VPLTDRSKAKEGGWAQVRAAMLKFTGDVVSAEFGKWGGQMVDPDTGKQLPPKEFLEVACENVEVLEVTEELTMEVTEFNFRINCSDYKGSFWVEMFLESADKFKLLIPDGLEGKRITFEKQTLEAEDPKYNSTNFVILDVAGTSAKKTTPKVRKAAQEPEEVAGEVEQTSGEDPMEVARQLAIGKTEAQFKTAVALHPVFVGSPLLNLAKAGMITKALIDDGKLVEVDGKYQEP